MPSYGMLDIVAVMGATYAKFGTEVAGNDGMRQRKWIFGAAEGIEIFEFLYFCFDNILCIYGIDR